MAFWAEESKRGQVNVEGSAAWLPSPIPRPENSGDMKPSTVAGNGPNIRNPAGGADGVSVGSIGGDRCQTRDGTAGIGGDVLSTSRLTI